MHHPKPRATRPAPALTALALLVASITGAQAQIWNGAGTSNNWSDRFNWLGSLSPLSSPNAALSFAGGSRLTPVQNIASVFTLNSLIFSDNAGAFTISGNALRFDGANARLVQNSSTSMAVQNDVQLAANLSVDGTGTITLAGNLTRVVSANRDTMVLTKRGSGNLVLAAANSYDATLRIDAGQVQLRNVQALQYANVALYIDNGLSFGTLTQATLGGLSGSGALALGSTALTIAGADNPGLYSGNITGTNGSITKEGSGTTRWSGVSQLRTLQVNAGRIQLEGGEVQVLGGLKLWSTGAEVAVNGGTLRAGWLDSVGAVGSIALLANPAGGAALVLDGGGNGSFAGVISGAGSLLKTGLGAQTLAGDTYAFTGTTTIRGGRIVVGHQDALRGSTVQIETNNGLDPNGLSQVVLGALAGNGALALGSTQLTVGETNRDTRYTGVLTGAAGSWLVKKGTGTLTLGGTGSELPNVVIEGGGAVVLDGGSLSLTSVSSLVSPPVRPALELYSGGRMELRNGARLDANGNGRSSVFLSGDDSTELLIDGTGSRLNAGFQTIAGNTDRGRITVRNGGSLEGWGYLMAGFYDGSNGTITLESGGRATAFSTGLGVLTGSMGTLVASDAGTQLVAIGELGMGGLSRAQMGGTGRLQVRAGALVQAGQTRFWTAASSIEIDGGSLVTGGLISDAGAGSITLTSPPQSNAPVLTLNGNGFFGNYHYGGNISGDGGLLKTGASTQVLDGRNSFTGMVQVQGGTLQMAGSSAAEYEVASGATLRLGERNLGFAVVQALTGGEVVYTSSTLNGGLLMGPGSHDISAVQRMVGTRLAGGAILTPASGATFVGVVSDGRINNLSGRSLTWIGGSNPSGALVVGGNVSVSSFSSGGQIQVDANGVLLSTSGNLVLGGGSRTTVGTVSQPGGAIELRAGGRLQLNGGLLVNNGRIQGPVEVNFGSLAKGAGEFGAVTVNDGGRFSPGNSPGTVTTSDATWGAGGSLLVELADARGAPGLGWDLWNIQGSLSVLSGTTANSRFTVSLASLDGSNQAAPLAGFDARRAWQWLIVDTQAGILGFDPNRVALDTLGFLSPLADGTLQLAVQDGDLYLQFAPAPVPEPQTWALMLGGLGVAGWMARRRRKG